MEKRHQKNPKNPKNVMPPTLDYKLLNCFQIKMVSNETSLKKNENAVL